MLFRSSTIFFFSKARAVSRTPGIEVVAPGRPGVILWFMPSAVFSSAVHCGAHKVELSLVSGQVLLSARAAQIEV